MADRAPLAGWEPWSETEPDGGRAKLTIGVLGFALRMEVNGRAYDGWYGLRRAGDNLFLTESYIHEPGGAVAAKLAAEDAARAMVADMVAALGGRVVWNESGVTP